MFVDKAAKCRDLPSEELEQHARGRIWTGAQAADRGLVDVVGGLDSALVEAARLARLPRGWQTVWVESPRPGFLARLLSMAPGVRSGEELLEGAKGELLDLRPDLVQARLPFEIRFL